ncbi:MAG TPA: hypothetical protein VH331_17275 [Allosphingosinicella sp.]|nr:hypothetical protein [Allosphingosinicella sp.]
MTLVVLTGASGAGKTVIARAFAALHPDEAEVHHFDSIGVPTVERMIAEHGSGDEWQRAMTIGWLARLAERVKAGRATLLEGQMRPSFVAEAARTAGLDDYHLILVDCDDTTRCRRLRDERNQPELAGPDMLSWAAFLREAAEREGLATLDTSSRSLAESVAFVLAAFRPNASE